MFKPAQTIVKGDKVIIDRRLYTVLANTQHSYDPTKLVLDFAVDVTKADQLFGVVLKPDQLLDVY